MSDIFPTLRTYEAYHKKCKPKEDNFNNLNHKFVLNKGVSENKVSIKDSFKLDNEEPLYLNEENLHEFLLNSLIISDSPIDDIRKIYSPTNEEKEFQNLEFVQFYYKKKKVAGLMKYMPNDNAYQMLQSLFCDYVLESEPLSLQNENTKIDNVKIAPIQKIPSITFTKYLANTKNYFCKNKCTYGRCHFPSSHLSKALFGNGLAAKARQNNNDDNSSLKLNSKFDLKLNTIIEKKSEEIAKNCYHKNVHLKDPYSFEHTTGPQFSSNRSNQAGSSNLFTSSAFSIPNILQISQPPISINLLNDNNENNINNDNSNYLIYKNTPDTNSLKHIQESTPINCLSLKGQEGNDWNANNYVQYVTKFVDNSLKFNECQQLQKSDVILCRESISPNQISHIFNHGMREDNQNSPKCDPNNTFSTHECLIRHDEPFEESDTGSWVTDDEEKDDALFEGGASNCTQKFNFELSQSHFCSLLNNHFNTSKLSKSRISDSNSSSSSNVSTLIDTIWEEDEDNEEKNEDEALFHFIQEGNVDQTILENEPVGTLLNTILEESEGEANDNSRLSNYEINLRLEASTLNRPRFSECAPRLSFYQSEKLDFEEQCNNLKASADPLNLESSFFAELTFIEDINNKQNSSYNNNNNNNNVILISCEENFSKLQSSAQTTYQTLLEHILRLCEPAHIIPFKNFISNIAKNLDFVPASQSTIIKRKKRRFKFVKIGEGSYAEVFALQLLSQEYMESQIESVFKVVSFENLTDTRMYSEMLSEAIISRLLGTPPPLKINDYQLESKNEITTGFIREKSISCCQGKYPGELLKAWDLFKDQRSAQTCINDRPDVYDKDAIFLVFQQEFGGESLEKFQFSNVRQITSVLLQIAYALNISERRWQFEHRDLHWSNILIKNIDTETNLIFLAPSKVYNNDIRQVVKSQGVQATIIDFTLSRLTTPDGCVHYRELSCEKDLFIGDIEEDYQFQVYRLMKQFNKNNWKAFTPYTNVLWYHYLLDKILLNKCQKLHKTKQKAYEKQFITSLNLVFTQCLSKCKNSADVCLLLQTCLPPESFL